MLPNRRPPKSRVSVDGTENVWKSRALVTSGLCQSLNRLRSCVGFGVIRVASSQTSCSASVSTVPIQRVTLRSF
jgi:hypothetical protein